MVVVFALYGSVVGLDGFRARGYSQAPPLRQPDTSAASKRVLFIFLLQGLIF